MFDFVDHPHDFTRVGGRNHNFVVRDGTYDKNILTEVMQYAVLDLHWKRVLDVGANIGAFTVLAYQLGVRSITAIEPDPDNFELLRFNVKTFDPRIVKTMRGAVMTDPPDEKITLYRSRTGKNPGTHSLYVSGGREAVTVPTIRWRDVIENENFDTIKMDVEGAEHDLLLNNGLPDSVTQVVFELHLNKKRWRTDTGPRIIEIFRDWECLRSPKITASNWTTWCAYRRS